MLFRTGQPTLYSVTVGGVYPPQCITVTDSKERAEAMADYLNRTIRGVVEVQEVDSFFPSHMADADQEWLEACDKFHQEERDAGL